MLIFIFAVIFLQLHTGSADMLFSFVGAQHVLSGAGKKWGTPTTIKTSCIF